MKFLVAALAAVSLSPVYALAQTPSSILQKAQERNWTLRAVSSDTIVAEGRVRRLVSDSIELGTAKLALHSIAQIQRRVRSNGGASGGGLIGALGFGMFGFFLASEFCKPECPLRDKAVGVGIGVTLGASLGGVIGGLTRPSESTWIPIWP